MKIFEIVFADGTSIIQFAENRQELRKKFASYMIVEINRVEIH